MREMELLIATADGEVVGRTQQDLSAPHPATFIGKGKVDEIRLLVESNDATLVAIDDELSPVQNRNLEQAWGVRVIDRTGVILDIFARHAHSREGKLQVELAQLEYLAPRLVGRGKMLSRLAGGIGTRGPGETQLEYDRRRIKTRITLLKSKLDDVRRHRHIHREKRSAVPIPLVSLVGYTNSGKSTLLNALTDAGVLVEDKLFSTLDPRVRRLRLSSGREILLADTVGFIRRLPHELVESFKATFEEMVHADVLVEVVDMSDPGYADRMQTVADVLKNLDLFDRPRIVAYNKSDIACAVAIPREGVRVSALSGEGIGHLANAIDALLRTNFRRVRLRIGHDRGDIVSVIYRVGHVLKVRHRGPAMTLDCELPEKFVGKYRNYIVPLKE